jgi:hypothetical protein
VSGDAGRSLTCHVAKITFAVKPAHILDHIAVPAADRAARCFAYNAPRLRCRLAPSKSSGHNAVAASADTT